MHAPTSPECGLAPTCFLPAFTPPKPQRIDFIKLDAQGADLPIMQGAGAYLSDILAVQMELQFIELYEGQPLFHEANQFMLESGFELLDLEPSRWLNRHADASRQETGRLVQCDALYCRPLAYWQSRGMADDDRLCRLMLVLAATGQGAEAWALLKTATEQRNGAARDELENLLFSVTLALYPEGSHWWSR